MYLCYTYTYVYIYIYYRGREREREAFRDFKDAVIHSWSRTPGSSNVVFCKLYCFEFGDSSNRGMSKQYYLLLLCLLYTWLLECSVALLSSPCCESRDVLTIPSNIYLSLYIYIYI